jgi:hypothetical protein
MLTAIDLIKYEKKIGGLNRATMVINELLATVKRNEVNEAIINYSTVSSLQRLGFILDEILNKKEIADKIFSLCTMKGIKFYVIPLKASGQKKVEVINEKWKLIINENIELDE